MNASLVRAAFRCLHGLLVSALFALFLPGLRAQLYTQRQTVPTDTVTEDNFGFQVSASGDTLAVGAAGRRIFVYGRSASTWTLQQTFTTRGGGVSLDGDTIASASEIYERVDDTWTLQATSTFMQGEPAFSDTKAVVRGDVVVMGSSSNPQNPFSLAGLDGFGEIWVRESSGWTLSFSTRGTDREGLGGYIATDGSTVVFGINTTPTGGPHGPKVYARSGPDWVYQGQLLVAPTEAGTGPVAVEGDTVALSHGSVRIYTRAENTWSLSQQLSPPSGVTYGAVAIRGGILAVAGSTGQAYTFARTSSGWVPAQTLPVSGAVALANDGKLCVIGNYDAARDNSSVRGRVDVFTVPPPSPPGSGWGSYDIGPVGVAGVSFGNGNSATMRGSGADIWDRADQLHFRSETLTGDGAIIAWVTSSGDTHPWAKVGLMARESLAPAARNFMALVTPGDHLGTQARADTGDATTFQDAGWAGAPIWLMVARSGDLFASYRSDNGIDWTAIGSATVKMPATIYVGLAVSSHDNTVRNSANFSAIEIVRGLPPPDDPPAAPTNLWAGNQTATTVTLSWTDNSSDETRFDVQRSTGTGGTFALVATTTANTSSYVDSGLLPNTEYTYRVRAVRDASFSAHSNTFTVRTLPQTDGGWTGSDIGHVGVAGSTSGSDSAFTLNAGGEDIWDQADGFRFHRRSWTGDGSVTARVATLGNTHPWAKAGVMIRESLAPGAANAAMLLTADNASGFQARTATGAATDFTSGPWVRAPYWVRIARSGNTFTGSVSPDGVNWTTVGSRTVSMASTVYIGLAASSHTTSAQTTASFDNVTVPDGPPPPPPPPPSDWTRALWGSAMGSLASSSAAEVDITTTGDDIWNASDAGLFAWKAWSGAGEIVARVDVFDAAHPWAKAGLMFRAGTGANAANAFVALTAGVGAIFQVRDRAGNSSTLVRQDWNPSVGARLKLTRQGNSFSAYYSVNEGAAWVLLGTQTVEMPAEVQAGLAVSSHDASANATANFSSVSLSSP